MSFFSINNLNFLHVGALSSENVNLMKQMWFLQTYLICVFYFLFISYLGKLSKLVKRAGSFGADIVRRSQMFRRDHQRPQPINRTEIYRKSVTNISQQLRRLFHLMLFYFFILFFFPRHNFLNL